MAVQSEESVRELVMVQEGRMPLQAVIFIVGLAVAHYVAKLGKTQLQGMAIWMIVMGAFLFTIWQVEWWEWRLFLAAMAGRMVVEAMGGLKRER